MPTRRCTRRSRKARTPTASIATRPPPTTPCARKTAPASAAGPCWRSGYPGAASRALRERAGEADPDEAPRAPSGRRLFPDTPRACPRACAGAGRCSSPRPDDCGRCRAGRTRRARQRGAASGRARGRPLSWLADGTGRRRERGVAPAIFCNNLFVAELKTRILVVDDDQRLRELLMKYLGGEGYEARAVPD